MEKGKRNGEAEETFTVIVALQILHALTLVAVSSVAWKQRQAV